MALLFYAQADSVHTTLAPPVVWRSFELPQGLPGDSAALRYFLGDGLPSLGLARPTGGPLTGAEGRRIESFLLYTITGVQPHSPPSLFASAWSGFAFWHVNRGQTGASLAHWLTQASPPQPTVPIQGVVQYGHGAPLVAIYATEGLAAYSGKPVPKNAPAPISHQLSRNVLGLGQRIAEQLAQDGVPTLFVNRVNDGEGELGAYLNSEKVVKQLLKTYPQLSLLLDVEQPFTPAQPAVVTRQGQQVARVTVVVGTNERLSDPTWQQNLAFGKQFGQALVRVAPQATVGVLKSPDRLNQQLGPHMLTLYVGGPSVTPAQAHNAAPLVAQAIVALIATSGPPPAASGAGQGSSTAAGAAQRAGQGSGGG